MSFLAPDPEHARRFLAALSPDQSFTFQTFCDFKSAGGLAKANAVRILHGRFDDVADDLVALNTGAGRAGVYVTVNQTDLKGRKATNIIGVRAVFVDLDGSPIEPVLNGALPPSIVVQSSPGKYHAYWLTDGLALADFTGFQKVLAALFDGDRSVSDLPRVLRMPGFLHMKAEPFLTEMMKCDPGLRYSRAQLVAAFGDPGNRMPSEGDMTHAPEAKTEGSFVNRAKAAKLVGTIAERLARDPKRGRHRQAVALGWEAKREALSQIEAEWAASAYHDLLPDTDSEGQHRPLAEAEIKAAVLNAYATGKVPNIESGLEAFFMTGSQLGRANVPARKSIVSPFILDSSLSMIWAKRGVGKTWFALELAFACATGKKFFAWDVPQKQNVLYIDGEMTLSALKERLNLISNNAPPDNLIFLPSEQLFLTGHPLRINDVKDQERVWAALDTVEAMGGKLDIVIFDNLSSLTSGMDENSNSDLDALLPWLVKLRHRGLAVILVHHAGKNGQQRGASRREDLLETSIKLEELPAEARNGSPGAGFTITFDKVRGKMPDPDKLNVQLVDDGHGSLAWACGSATKLPKELEALLYIYGSSPTMQSQMATAMNVSEPRMSELVGKLRGKGHVAARGLSLTPAGRELAVRLGGDQLQA